MHKKIATLLCSSLCLSLWLSAQTLLGFSPIQTVAMLNQLQMTATWQASEIESFDRPGFSFKFPSDWQLADHQPNYNPDRNITINTKGNSYITIEILKANPNSSEKKMLKNILFALDGPAIDTYSRSKFNEWGDFKGAGKHLKGKILSLKPGGIRLFSGIQGKHLIVVTEFYYSQDLENSLPGFDLISQTFVFKEV